MFHHHLCCCQQHRIIKLILRNLLRQVVHLLYSGQHLLSFQIRSRLRLGIFFFKTLSMWNHLFGCFRLEFFSSWIYLAFSPFAVFLCSRWVQNLGLGEPWVLWEGPSNTTSTDLVCKRGGSLSICNCCWHSFLEIYVAIFFVMDMVAFMQRGIGQIVSVNIS